MNTDIFFDGFKTVVRMIADIIDEVKASGLSPNATFVNFEEHSTLYELPNQDVIGLGSFGMTITDMDLQFDVAFAISTVEDQHLYRHVEIANSVVRRTLPGQTHTLLDAETGAEIGALVVTGGTQVKYVERTDKRNMRLIFATFMTPRL